MKRSIQSAADDLKRDVDFCSVRYYEEQNETIAVERGTLLPFHRDFDGGAMVTVADKGGTGYCATSDVSPSGLLAAKRRAHTWAKRTANCAVTDYSRVRPEPHQGSYESPVQTDWSSLPLAERIDLVRAPCDGLKSDDRVVMWQSAVNYTKATSYLWSSDGADIEQRFSYIAPALGLTVSDGKRVQSRSLGARALARQGGKEVLDDVKFFTDGPRLVDEALQLLAAPSCPAGTMDLLLAPDQMVLQVHESIGHPLELDRILGDERNYAGTSFVTLDMFGSYAYGSPLLNVTFDPTAPGELASYGFDDDGEPATKTYVIQDGILKRPLGGRISQLRADMPGVGNSRACSWNRPPIDRMANLNMEPGTSSFDDMVSSVERGVFMQTNCSWSIDDSRNKFQFGCQYGRLIENGELTSLVRTPNYRGISATFWRNLKAVGDPSTHVMMGTPNCGKGEPNQVIRVGHATPTSLFADVEVFGEG